MGGAPDPDQEPKHFHILNAASNLLGISLIIVTGLHVTGRSATTLADDIAWIAALCFAASCLLSYLAIRGGDRGAMFELWADRIFLAGLVTVLVSVAALAVFSI